MRKENKVIRGLWIGKSLSLMEQLSIKSFLANGHEYHLYIYGKVKNIPKGVIVKDANMILPKSRIFKYDGGFGAGSYSGFANLFRLKLLLDKGGIWADLDIICLRSFDFKEGYVFASEKLPDGKIKVNNGIIKAPKGSEFIKECYKKAEIMNSKTLLHGQNGADLLELNIDKFNLKHFVFPPNFFCPIGYWDFKKPIDPNFKFKISKETYAIHLWNEMWGRESKNNNIRNCIKKDVGIKQFIYKTSAELKKHS